MGKVSPVQIEDVPPAPALFNSMRHVGYDLHTALADLVDNSIAAHATRVDIRFGVSPYPFVAICDDGHGMSRSELRTAMTLAGADASVSRARDDLGRFGLGLKTASLSQCRQLSVVSSDGGGLHGAIWDLDFVAENNRWGLQTADGSDILAWLPEEVSPPSKTGTVVLWKELDQLEIGNGISLPELDAVFMEARNWLGFIFHRFLQHRKGLTLSVNGNRVPEKDPFLEENPATQRHSTVFFDERRICVEPFTLPAVEKLTRNDRKKLFLAEADTLEETQGFYLYRGRRLISWGDWFGIQPRKAQTRLVRVKVDVPNLLDEEWSLDIKKSRAVPPKELKDKLRSFVPAMTRAGRRTVDYRGRRVANQASRQIWTEISDRNGFRFEVNTEHPIVQSTLESLTVMDRKQVKQLLDVIASTFPVQTAVARVNGDMEESSWASKDHSTALLQRAARAWELMRQKGYTQAEFVEYAREIEPFKGLEDAQQLLSEAVHLEGL